ncbi:STAS domain-containing protein [Dactylosporangium sp. CA-092794]|uniref:STAS domain-containing protein n=1 Tax=Dactylosporangium sp. CA-092794 TaxID=3239929 RepID=UPI003D90616A
MTALLTRDGADFSLVCDGCGWVAGNLAASLGTWDVAWGLFGRDGWRGSELAIGPHVCGGCEAPAALVGMVARALDRRSVTPAGRPSPRMVVQLLSDVRAVCLRGDLLPADDARLWDLLGGEPGRYRHLMVDVSGVRRLSSATVGVLVRASRRTSERGGRACLVGAAVGLSSALRMLCLDQVLPGHADQVSALEWLRGRQPVRSLVA